MPDSRAVRPRPLVLLVFLAALAALAHVPVAYAAAPRGLTTAIYLDRPELFGQDGDLAHDRVVAAGATVVRIGLVWSDIAPIQPMAGFNPSNPDDSQYRWAEFDQRIRMTVKHGLQPLVTIYAAPEWAQRSPPSPGLGGHAPDVKALGAFAKAAALRYSGVAELPLVRYWQVWNEPNLSAYLTPQLERGRVVSAALYRTMVNSFARAVHAVRRDNVVVAGGQSPFTFKNEYGLVSVAPMRFMRELLCMSGGPRPRPTCRDRIAFDVWAHHPYTSGGPEHKAARPDDVSLGDLPEMRDLLRAAESAGKILSRQKVGFWVTEFSWDSQPPDPKGVPARLHARWVAEALYRMWRAEVSLVTWYVIRDEPFPASFFQSGLYYRGSTFAQDRPKPALQAFRFPFVAFGEKSRIHVWGRTPSGKKGTVVIEQSFPGGWRRLGVLNTNRYGLFEDRLPSTSLRGFVRARLTTGGPGALPFQLKKTPDLDVDPFGTVG